MLVLKGSSNRIHEFLSSLVREYPTMTVREFTKAYGELRINVGE